METRFFNKKNNRKDTPRLNLPSPLSAITTITIVDNTVITMNISERCCNRNGSPINKLVSLLTRPGYPAKQKSKIFKCLWQRFREEDLKL